MITADEMLETGSPFSLRIHSTWVHLEGVTPGVGQTPDRPRSEFVTVDGHRYAQQAPRANREWTLDWQYATPAAVAAATLAAEAPGDVWLHDAASARANMLDPRLCYGHDDTAPVLDCGGLPLRLIAPGLAVEAAPVRGGVVYSFGLWSIEAVGVDIGTLVYPGGTQDLHSAGSGVRTTATFTPTVDGTLLVGINGGGYPATGLQLVEGSLPPTWIPGERTPCKVSVADPVRTLNLLRGSQRGRSDYNVTLREVG